MNTFLARTLYFSLQVLRREPIFSVLSDVYRTEFLTLEELRAVQADRMIAQLMFSLENVPYYRKKYLSLAPLIRNLSHWDDVNELMNDLPPVSKDDLLNAPEQFTAQNLKKLRTYPDKTSGSTGTPLIFPCDQCLGISPCIEFPNYEDAQHSNWGALCSIFWTSLGQKI
jgi:phenylacetate-coenzyme A ligase PaaK-like adenylate-forming protein